MFFVFPFDLNSPLVCIIQLHLLRFKLTIGLIESHIRISPFPTFHVFPLQHQTIFSELNLELRVLLLFQSIHDGFSFQTEFFLFQAEIMARFRIHAEKQRRRKDLHLLLAPV